MNSFLDKVLEKDFNELAKILLKAGLIFAPGFFLLLKTSPVLFDQLEVTKWLILCIALSAVFIMVSVGVHATTSACYLIYCRTKNPVDENVQKYHEEYQRTHVIEGAVSANAATVVALFMQQFSPIPNIEGLSEHVVLVVYTTTLFAVWSAFLSMYVHNLISSKKDKFLVIASSGVTFLAGYTAVWFLCGASVK